MIRRRQFLFGTLGVLGLAGVGALTFGRSAAEAEIAAAVRRRLSFLKLDDAALHAFAHDQVSALLAKRPTWNRLKYHFLSNVSTSFKRYARSSDTRTRRQRLEDGWASTFLLSSDFFVNGADLVQPVSYLAFYDPLRACGNPFARPPGGANAAAANATGAGSPS
jgi:hypothetical protein